MREGRALGNFPGPNKPASFDRVLNGKYPVPNQLRVIRLAGNNFLNWPQAAHAETFDRPVILEMMNDEASPAPGFDNALYCLPTELADPAPGLYPISITAPPAAVSSVKGRVYLPAGRWYIYYPDTSAINVLVLDASDPVFALMYLAKPGNQSTTLHPNDISVLASTSIAAGRANRKALFIQNMTGNPGDAGGTPTAPGGAIRIAIGETALEDKGLRLPPIYADGAQHPPLILAGSCLATQEVFAISEDGATTCKVNVIELF